MLGAAILWWTYHDFDFRRVWSVLDGGMNYGWMAFSLVFGVFGHLFRGWRWNLTLAPLGEYPKLSNSVYAVFVSYAANLVVPRVGEVSRCGVLAKYDGGFLFQVIGYGGDRTAHRQYLCNTYHGGDLVAPVAHFCGFL